LTNLKTLSGRLYILDKCHFVRKMGLAKSLMFSFTPTIAKFL
jgi:hypothetical protein